ncbi:MAG: TIGR04283 family arsenosugar biosynthesis glycosyltransferase [Flavobacteriaceae bacterium]
MPKKEKHTISIIVPVLNEEQWVGPFLRQLNSHLPQDNTTEILVVDGGSSDKTVSKAKENGGKVVASTRGRAIQMNTGARMAKGDILYFLHVDTLPPPHFCQHITTAVRNGHQAGCFQMRFDSTSPFLRFFAWFTRFNWSVCRGGDQSLYVDKALFLRTGGYNEDYRIYEDNELAARLGKLTRFKVLPQKVVTSARKYQLLGTWRLQYHFARIHLKNYLGAGPEALYQYYQKNIGAPSLKA